MFLFRKRRLLLQIEEYLMWKEKRYGGEQYTDREFLLKFTKISKAADVSEITAGDTTLFNDYINTQYQTTFSCYQSEKTIRCFLRYFKARKYPCLDPYNVRKYAYLRRY